MKQILNSEVDLTRAYGGANEIKQLFFITIKYTCRTPPINLGVNKLISYANSCISEHISCLIIKTLGLNSQNTILGKYEKKIMVTCEDFASDYRIFDFASLKYNN